MRNVLFSNGGWLLRILTVTALVAVIALSLYPAVISHRSTSAVVNAQVLIVRSPVKGVVESSAVLTGSFVAAGQEMIVFRETATDIAELADLKARLSIASAAAQSTSHRLATVKAIKTDLSDRQAAYSGWHIAILRRELDEIKAQLVGASSRLRALDADALQGAPETSTERAVLSARLQELAARRDVRRLKLSAMRDGILAGTAGTNTPYTLQRQDEIALELAQLNDELMDHRAEAAALRAQLESHQAYFRRTNRMALASPVSGIVWRSSAQSGRAVLPGDEVVEILDCTTRFLEAYLPEGLFGTIAIGDLVDVRLTGERTVFQAPIMSVLGQGARFDHTGFAAQNNAPNSGMMRLVIRLSAPPAGQSAGHYCDVGRTAEVSFPRELTRLGNVGSKLTAALATVSAWFESAPGQMREG